MTQALAEMPVKKDYPSVPVTERQLLTVANVKAADDYVHMSPLEAAAALREEGFDVPDITHFFLYSERGIHTHEVLVRNRDRVEFSKSGYSQFYEAKQFFMPAAQHYLQMPGPHTAIIYGHGYGIPDKYPIDALTEAGFDVRNLQNENARYEFHDNYVPDTGTDNPLSSWFSRFFAKLANHEGHPAVVLREGKISPIICYERFTNPYREVFTFADRKIKLPLRPGEVTLAGNFCYEGERGRGKLARQLGVDVEVLEEIWNFSLWEPERIRN